MRKVRKLTRIKRKQWEVKEAMDSSVLNKDLEIAQLLYERKSYSEIAKELKVSPKTISQVRKKVEAGVIEIDESGKAKYAEGKRAFAMGPGGFTLNDDQLARIYGIAHLENMSPSEVLDALLDDDRMLRRKYGLSFKERKMVSDTLNAAVERGWKIRSEPDIIDCIKKGWSMGIFNHQPETVMALLELAKELKAHRWDAAQFVDEATKAHNAVYWFRQYKAGLVSAETARQKVASYL
jgi:DNA-binding Lrp family transcriptional regulator